MPASAHTPSNGLRRSLQPRTILLLTAAGIGLSLGMLALGALVQLDTWRDTWRQADQASENVLVALEQNITRNVAIIDLSMQGVIEALAEPGIDSALPRVRHQALFDRATSAEDLGSLLVLDPTGAVVEDSTALEPHRINLGERDYFRVHQERADAGLYVSRPFKSKMRADDLSISFSRRIPTSDGRFGGVVSSALRLTYFQHLFEALNLGKGGAITLLRTDGRLIARFPFKESDVDRDLSQTPIFRTFMAESSGHYVGTAGLDGIKRLFTFRQVRGLPLILTINVSVEEVLAAWKAKAFVTGTILVLLSTATMGLCLLFRRELVHRAAAERALEDAAERLAQAASTDALTGLPNRRKFQEDLQAEWRQAVADRQPIGLLMLDADFFKLYNDRYGHPEGDRVLLAIAGCLKAYTRQSLDLSARYGGEEFVVVLSRANAREAVRIAERIRVAVEALSISHADSPIGRVTVSVGMAVARPRTGDAPALLLKEADDALYAAKRAGRNRVQVAALTTLLEETAPDRGIGVGRSRVPS